MEEPLDVALRCVLDAVRVDRAHVGDDRCDEVALAVQRRAHLGESRTDLRAEVGRHGARGSDALVARRGAHVRNLFLQLARDDGDLLEELAEGKLAAHEVEGREANANR